MAARHGAGPRIGTLAEVDNRPGDAVIAHFTGSPPVNLIPAMHEGRAGDAERAKPCPLDPAEGRRIFPA